MDEVPWLLVLLVALIVSMVLAGISLFRATSHASSHAAIFVLLTSAIFSTPLVLLWALVNLSAD